MKQAALRYDSKFSSDLPEKGWKSSLTAICRVSPAREEENPPVLSSEDSPRREGTTLRDKDLSTWKKFHTTLEEKGSLSHLPVCHLRTPMLSTNLKDGEQNKLEGNASSLTH